MTELYVGLISGTSVDGVDAVLVELGTSSFAVRAAETRPFPQNLRNRIAALIDRPETSLAELGALDVALGQFFADSALAVIASAGVAPADVVAIGHHGQTVFHKPEPPEPFTLQLGDPNVIAARTGITTVADFRRLDVALGGQGAPLVPAFHAWRFADRRENRVVVNIGGIANVTMLPAGGPVTGFDTGPGNTLLDRWIERMNGSAYDRDGAWAAGGRVDRALLESLQSDPYFAAAPPKSTGRERFNLAWLLDHLGRRGETLAPRDVQATLAELTAATIADAIRREAAGAQRLIVCGGGAHNADLLARLGRRSGLPVETTARYGVPPDWVEGAAFAWLAHARLRGLPGSVAAVTGARREAVLGGVYCGASPGRDEDRACLDRGRPESQTS
ncbi:MAG TPA: anhydro-N-acetylmuramic acid kinase [Gammaproteobacteria bacterium]